MLAAIDAKAGGKLVQLDRAPEDSDLALALTGKIMARKLQVWELTGDDGQERSGNWVLAVAPSRGGKRQAQAQTQAQQTVKQQAAPVQTMDDGIDDIPF